MGNPKDFDSTVVQFAREIIDLVQDPSVMSAALCALQEVTSRDPRPYKNVIPSFVSILKQVSQALPAIPFELPGMTVLISVL